MYQRSTTITNNRRWLLVPYRLALGTLVQRAQLCIEFLYCIRHGINAITHCTMRAIMGVVVFRFHCTVTINLVRFHFHTLRALWKKLPDSRTKQKRCKLWNQKWMKLALFPVYTKLQQVTHTYSKRTKQFRADPAQSIKRLDIDTCAIILDSIKS